MCLELFNSRNPILDVSRLAAGTAANETKTTGRTVQEADTGKGGSAEGGYGEKCGI